MNRPAIGLLLLLAASSLVFPGVAGMSLFGPQTFGAGDNGKTVTVTNGETFWLSLPENPTTGYAWDLKLSDGLTKLSDKYEPADRSGLKVGVGGTHSYELKAMKNGSQVVTGSYRQAGNESLQGLETYTLNVNVAEGGSPLSGLFRLSAPLIAGTPGAASLTGSTAKMLLPHVGNVSATPILPPTVTKNMFPIIQNGGTPEPPLSAARNQRTPRDIPMSYTDVPPADTVSASVGDNIVLSLPENPSTGYSWQMSPSEGIEPVSDNYLRGNSGSQSHPVVGAGGTHEYVYKVMKPGAQTITGIYKRPWERSSQGEKTYTLNVNVA